MESDFRSRRVEQPLDPALWAVRPKRKEAMMNARDVGRLYTQRDLKGLLEVCRYIAETQDRRQIDGPTDVVDFLAARMATLEQEELWVILLDMQNRVIAEDHHYRGSLNTTLVRTGELFREAIRNNAASIIIAHNHPSGDPMPSPEDVAFTRAVVEAGKLLDIDVLDHIVVGAGRSFSLKAKGLGFNA